MVVVTSPPPPPPVAQPPPAVDDGPIYSQVQKKTTVTTVTPAQYARVGEMRSFDVYSHRKVTVKIQGMSKYKLCLIKVFGMPLTAASHDAGFDNPRPYTGQCLSGSMTLCFGDLCH